MVFHKQYLWFLVVDKKAEGPRLWFSKKGFYAFGPKSINSVFLENQQGGGAFMVSINGIYDLGAKYHKQNHKRLCFSWGWELVFFRAGYVGGKLGVAQESNLGFLPLRAFSVSICQFLCLSATHRKSALSLQEACLEQKPPKSHTHTHTHGIQAEKIPTKTPTMQFL